MAMYSGPVSRNFWGIDTRSAPFFRDFSTDLAILRPTQAPTLLTPQGRELDLICCRD